MVFIALGLEKIIIQKPSKNNNRKDVVHIDKFKHNNLTINFVFYVFVTYFAKHQIFNDRLNILTGCNLQTHRRFSQICSYSAI